MSVTSLICLKSALMKSSEQHQKITFEVILSSKNPAEKHMKLKLHSILCGLRFPRTLKNNSLTTFPQTPLIGQVRLHCRRRNSHLNTLLWSHNSRRNPVALCNTIPLPIWHPSRANLVVLPNIYHFTTQTHSMYKIKLYLLICQINHM